MARYILKAGLGPAIARRDWAAVARGYNGPGYAKNRYDRRLQAVFARHSSTGASVARSGGLLRLGDSGAAVADLQTSLSAAGYPLEIDGDFGPLTDAAVRRFQRDNGLVGDGIAGPQTLAALAGLPGPWERLWRLLVSLFRRMPAQR
jgi:murein L,D-transpeptidase YcbB/YkuD